MGIAVILAAVGLPAEAIGVLLVFDRLLDMARTAVNVLADAACTVIVARLEGETEVLSVSDSFGTGPAKPADAGELIRATVCSRIRRPGTVCSGLSPYQPSPASCGKLIPTVLNPPSTYRSRR